MSFVHRFDDGDPFTCFMGQQMGFFDVDDPSECNKSKDPDMGEHGTPAHFIAHGALKCCKSKKVDQSVCKIDKCVSGMMKCMDSHGHKIERFEKQLTHPKAMDENEEGILEGSCPIAIFNRVEGTLCCTAAMKEMTMCVSREVGNYTVCKESWDKFFEPDFFAHAEAVMESFKAGGYCSSFGPNPTTIGADKTHGCPKCGSFESGKQSCCAPGGTWFGDCGNSGDSKFEHTWFEGIQACDSTMPPTIGPMPPTPGPMPPTPGPAIPGMPLPCEKASDFNGQNEFGEGHTCQSLAGVLMPRSAAECDKYLGDGPETKGELLKHMYGMCCKPGSKPNGICGLKINTATPCENKAHGEFMPEAK